MNKSLCLRLYLFNFGEIVLHCCEDPHYIWSIRCSFLKSRLQRKWQPLCMSFGGNGANKNSKNFNKMGRNVAVVL